MPGKRSEPDPWYANGLRFGCQRCGACCRIEGYVWVDRRAVRKIAELLDLSIDDFGHRYLRRVGRRYALTEKAGHDCVFWDNGCVIYEARPIQCRTFPFWREVLKSAEDWAQAATLCHGIGEGKLYELGEIETLSAGHGGTETSVDQPSCSGCGTSRRRQDDSPEKSR